MGVGNCEYVDMSELLSKQFEFCEKLAILIQIIHSMGYRVKFAPDSEKHMDGSLHYKSLAKDLLLFKEINGKWEWLSHSLDYKPVGERWEQMGGSWGGRFDESYPGAGDGRDGNHFSIAYGGVK